LVDIWIRSIVVVMPTAYEGLRLTTAPTLNAMIAGVVVYSLLIRRRMPGTLAGSARGGAMC
jgi:hypothetical protein